MGKYMRKCKARISSNDHHHHHHHHHHHQVSEEQVGVRTRARTLAAMASAATATTSATTTTTRKRKFGTNITTCTADSSHELQSFLQLRSRKLLITTTFSEKQNTTPITSTNNSVGDKNSDNCGAALHRLLPCSSSAIVDNVSHHQHQYSVSRCSSNGSSMLVNNNKNLMSSSSAAVDLIEGGGGDEGFELMDNSTYSPDCRKRRERTPSSNLRALVAEESGDLDSTERHQITSESMKERMASIESEIDDFFSVAEKQEQKRFSERYNFDFIRELPMEGRYEWVR